MQQFVEAFVSHIVIGEGFVLHIHHLISVALQRAGHGERTAMADPQFGHDTIVHPLAVSGDVEVEQMCVGILYRTGYT